jgi:hypothetical protein
MHRRLAATDRHFWPYRRGRPCIFGSHSVNDIIGAYLSVEIRITPLYEHMRNFDLFQNAETAAVVD